MGRQRLFSNWFDFFWNAIAVLFVAQFFAGILFAVMMIARRSSGGIARFAEAMLFPGWKLSTMFGKEDLILVNLLLYDLVMFALFWRWHTGRLRAKLQ